MLYTDTEGPPRTTAASWARSTSTRLDTLPSRDTLRDVPAMFRIEVCGSGSTVYKYLCTSLLNTKRLSFPARFKIHV